MENTMQFLMADGTMVTTQVFPNSTRGQQGRLELALKRFLEQGDMIVGFETEWSFDAEEAQVCSLKLCTRDSCLIIPLISRYYHRLLRKFFANKDIVFAGVHIKKDLEKMEKQHRLEIRNAVELSEKAAKVYESPCVSAYGVKDLVRTVLSRHCHTFSMSESPPQVDYHQEAETLDEKKKMEHATAVAYAIYKTAKILLNL
ncbi:hypothetical protein ACOSQ3_014837 [Xanthoceras sorbifolium]